VPLEYKDDTREILEMNIERKHNKHNRDEQKAGSSANVEEESTDEVDSLILWHLAIKIGIQH